MRNFIFYYNHLKKESHLFTDREQWVLDENDPEIEAFMKTPYAKYFNGYEGIRYMIEGNIVYFGFFVETPTGIGITEFQSLTSLMIINDAICRLGEKDIDIHKCTDCLKQDIVRVNALISVDKLLNGGYVDERKEYGDFFTDEVLNLKMSE